MEKKQGLSLSVILGAITAIVTFFGLLAWLAVAIDAKKKEKEDKELEDYLESVIS